MAANGNVPLKVEAGMSGCLSDLPVLESVHPYEGAMGGYSAGYVRPLAAGDMFLGHFYAEKSNAAGASGDVSVRLRQGRYRAQVTIASVAITDVGKPVYASADNAYSLTATGYSRVGTVVRYVTTNTAIVEFDTVPQAGEAGQSGVDLLLQAGNDFDLRPGKVAADQAALQAYDIDGSAWVDVVLVQSHATAPALGFFGKSPSAQIAHIADHATAFTQCTTTELVTLAQKINAALVAIETHGLVATS
jgi:hypothetical protein